MLKIVIASDHGGFLAKSEVKSYLLEKGYDVTDVGTYSSESCHYPIYAKKAAQYVSEGKSDFGILICSSGEGVCITANKIKGVRCGIAYNNETAALLRQHNNANMVAFGAKFMSTKDIIDRIEIFLKTPFEGGRHQVRVDMIENN